MKTLNKEKKPWLLAVEKVFKHIREPHFNIFFYFFICKTFLKTLKITKTTFNILTFIHQLKTIFKNDANNVSDKRRHYL